MTLAALELNDQSLLIQADDGTLHAEPGFARMTPDGIVTGEQARAAAWREPQHSYNQYWCHLNQTPLASKEKLARHHGDIAFAQLRQVWEQAGSPAKLLLLAPGSFADAQVSLLLGMANALPAEVLVLIDSALAACLEVERETLHVDLQLHQSVLTLCRPQGKSLGIVDQEVFPDLGIMQIHNSIARYVSNLLIDSSRYDPLHDSGNEQAIFDQIPAWLTRLRFDREVSSTMESDKGELPFILRQDQVKKLVSDRLVNMSSFADRHPNAALLLSHTSGLLAGLSEIFASADVAAPSAAADHCLARQADILEQVQGLYRVQSLQRSEAARAPVAELQKLATHVLYRDRALPLHKPVSIRIGEQGVELSNAVDDAAELTVVLRNRSLEAVHRSPGLDALLPEPCLPGESIQVGGHQLRLIEVADA